MLASQWLLVHKLIHFGPLSMWQRLWLAPKVKSQKSAGVSCLFSTDTEKKKKKKSTANDTLKKAMMKSTEMKMEATTVQKRFPDIFGQQ